MAFTKATAQTVGWVMNSSSDHVTPTAPTNLAVTISKDGGAFASPAGVATSVSDGFCTFAGTAADWNADVVALKATGTGVDPVVLVFYTEAAYTPARAGNLDNLDATVSSRAAASSALSTAVWTNDRAAKLDNLDAAVSSRAPAATAVSSNDLTATRIAKLDNLDAAISTRAPASTALSNTTWTDDRASKLDSLEATVSAAQEAVQQDIGELSATIRNRWANDAPPGGGAMSVTLTVMTDEDPPDVVPGAYVSILGAGMQVTDESGTVTFNLNDGTYSAVIRSSAFYTPAPAYIVRILDGALTEPPGGILTVTPKALDGPASPGACRCYLYMYHSNGITPLSASEGSLHVAEIIQRPAAATVVYDDDSNADDPAPTDGDGLAYLDLPRGMVCLLTANWPDRGDRTARVTVPDAATYNLAALFQDTVPVSS